MELLNAGFDVVVVDNYANSCPESIYRVEKIAEKSVKLYEADVSVTTLHWKRSSRREENDVIDVMLFHNFQQC